MQGSENRFMRHVRRVPCDWKVSVEARLIASKRKNEGQTPSRAVEQGSVECFAGHRTVVVPGLDRPVYVAEDAESKTGSTGLQIWACALMLATELVPRLARTAVPMPTVVELGCGVGLAGVVAAMLGAAATLTDRSHECLELARATAAANQQVLYTRNVARTRCMVCQCCARTTAPSRSYHAYAHVHTHTYTNVHTHAHAHAYALPMRISVHMSTRMSTDMCTHISIHTSMPHDRAVRAG